jgi:hypothetical protein
MYSIKTVEKITRDGDIQIFEIITTRKDLREFLRDLLWDGVYSSEPLGIWNDCDSSLHYYDTNGLYHGFSEGDPVKRINHRTIDRLISDNGCTTVIFGDVQLIYNDRYGDWETALD